MPDIKFFNKLNFSVTVKLTVSVLFIAIMFSYFFYDYSKKHFTNEMIAKAKVISESGSKMIGKTLEDAINKKLIVEYDLFNPRFIPIVKTNPIKYNTQYDSVTDRIFPFIQDAFMTDKEIMFAVSISKDRYVPTHNSIYRKPLTGHYNEDKKHNRTKRIFKDKKYGIFKKISNVKKGSFVHLYERDTGEVFWLVASPVYVNKKHWGAFLVGMRKENIDKKLFDLRKKMALMFIVFVVFVITIEIVLLRKIINPIIRISEHVNTIAGGNISSILKIDVKDNEIGMLLQNVNAMSSSLRGNMTQITDAISTFDLSITELSTAMNEEASAINQQTASIAETSSAMEQLNSISHEIEEHSRDILKAMSENINIANESKESLKELQEIINIISERNRISKDEIFELKNKSKKIEEVMLMIDSIADQTKLIAFNATIEAVGSGETGKRFSIVAEEIRRLANTVILSTEKIKNYIHEIHESTNTILDLSKAESSEIERSVQSAVETDAAFDMVLERSDETYETVKNITHSISQQKNATEQVLNAIKDISEGAIMVNNNVSNNLDKIKYYTNLSDMLKLMVQKFKL